MILLCFKQSKAQNIHRVLKLICIIYSYWPLKSKIYRFMKSESSYEDYRNINIHFTHSPHHQVNTEHTEMSSSRRSNPFHKHGTVKWISKIFYNIQHEFWLCITWQLYILKIWKVYLIQKCRQNNLLPDVRHFGISRIHYVFKWVYAIY
jgi:hypothetical protein